MTRRGQWWAAIAAPRKGVGVFRQAAALPGRDRGLCDGTLLTRHLGDAVEIRVRDNGTGIPGEIKDKLFEPLFTTKPTGEGTGLGLSISYDIVTQKHGGTIEASAKSASSPN